MIEGRRKTRNETWKKKKSVFHSWHPILHLFLPSASLLGWISYSGRSFVENICCNCLPDIPSLFCKQHPSSLQKNLPIQYECVCVCVCVNGLVVSNFCDPHGLQPTRLPSPQNSPGKNTGVGSHSLLQGIFSTQGLNPVEHLHCRQIFFTI